MVSLKSEGSWVGWQSQARVLAQEPRCGVHKGVTVPGRLKKRLEELQKQIVSGTIMLKLAHECSFEGKLGME